MMRPQIRPAVFIGLQNGMAAALFTCLLATELNRRLLYAHPGSETLWWLATVENRLFLPLLRLLEVQLGNPDKLLLGLVAGIALPLLAWWTRYWLVTALSGHLTLAGLVMITATLLQRGTMGEEWMGPLQLLSASDMPWLAAALIILSLFVLVMCIADHVAFIRFIIALFRRLFARK